MLRHNVVDLALHRLRDGSGTPLLLLHGLGERSPEQAPAWTDGWKGPVHALDFTGHGGSTVPRGGGYSAEVLIAGARPKKVRGAVLGDGPGLAGGGGGPLWGSVLRLPQGPHVAPDPWALAELSRDVRPPDYAASFVRLALQFSDLRTPIVVVARVRPAWLDAVADEPGVAEAATMAEGLAQLDDA